MAARASVLVETWDTEAVEELESAMASGELDAVVVTISDNSSALLNAREFRQLIASRAPTASRSNSPPTTRAPGTGRDPRHADDAATPDAATVASADRRTRSRRDAGRRDLAYPARDAGR